MKRDNTQGSRYQKVLGIPQGFSFTMLESSTPIGEGVLLNSWFIRQGTDIIRTETYQAEDGSVVAYQDTFNGEPEPLYMDAAFKELHKDERDLYIILQFAGVLDLDKVEVFYTGGPK